MRKPKIVLGRVNPASLRKPQAQRYLSPRFTQELTEALGEAKAAALRVCQAEKPEETLAKA